MALYKPTLACVPHFVLFSVPHVSTLFHHISFRLHFNSGVTLAVNTSVYTLIETPPSFPSLIARLLPTGSRLHARRNLWQHLRVCCTWLSRRTCDVTLSARPQRLRRSQLVSRHTAFIALQQKPAAESHVSKTGLANRVYNWLTGSFLMGLKPRENTTIFCFSSSRKGLT